MWPIVGTMLLCGAVGGLANFLRVPGAPPSHSDVEPSVPLPSGWVRFGSSLLAAEIAAFLVPLFLSLASSNLVGEAQADGKKMLVLAGFCLAAATLSNRFTDTVSQRVLSQVEGTKQEARAANTRSKQVAAKQNQIEAALTEPDHISPQGLHATADALDEKTVVLSAFEESRYVFRSLAGIAQDTNLPLEAVRPTLNELVHNGQLAVTEREGGTRWYRPTTPVGHPSEDRETEAHAL